MNLGGNLEEICFLKCISKFSVSVVSGLHKSHPRCEYLMKKFITSVSLPLRFHHFDLCLKALVSTLLLCGFSETYILKPSVL